MAIEFSRNVTFGQFLDLRSPVHRLDPRTKVVVTAALMVGGLAARGFAAMAVLVGALALIQIISRIPLGYALRGLRLVFFTTAFLLVFQVLFYRDPPVAWWRWWILSISPAGLLQGLLTLLRILVLYYVTSVLMFTTSLVDLADGVEIGLSPLKRLRVPVHELVLTMVVALKFVPLLIAELERLVKAQAARGASIDQGGLLARARALGAVLVPLFVGALTRAEVLTTAMNARCYRGGQGRTKRRTLSFRRADALALLVGVGLAALSLAVGRMVAW